MRANFSTHCSLGARRLCAEPTIRMIWARVVSFAALLVTTSRAPSPLTVPAKTSSPSTFNTGTLSPVIGA